LTINAKRKGQGKKTTANKTILTARLNGGTHERKNQHHLSFWEMGRSGLVLEDGSDQKRSRVTGGVTKVGIKKPPTRVEGLHQNLPKSDKKSVRTPKGTGKEKRIGIQGKYQWRRNRQREIKTRGNQRKGTSKGQREKKQ